MINVKKAYDIFKKKYPKLTVVECIDYKGAFIFTALEDPNKIEYDDPYYAVNKTNGDVSFFSIGGDIEGFLDACMKSKVDWK